MAASLTPSTNGSLFSSETKGEKKWADFIAFGETKIGSSVVTLLMTGVIGAFLSNYFSSMQKDHDHDMLEAGRLEVVKQDYVAFAGKIIADRRVSVSLLHSALVRPTFTGELERRWHAYEDSYIQYNRDFFKAHVDLSGLRRGTAGSNILGVVLDNDITPSFQRLDNCLTRVVDHRAFTISKSARLTAIAGGKAAIKDFSHCGKTNNGRLWSYLTETRKLDECISEFRTQLEWVTITTERAQRQNNFWSRQAISMKRFLYFIKWNGMVAPLTSFKGDWLTGEHVFWKNLPSELAKSCGMLRGSHYDDEVEVQ